MQWFSITYRAYIPCGMPTLWHAHLVEVRENQVQFVTINPTLQIPPLVEHVFILFYFFLVQIHDPCRDDYYICHHIYPQRGTQYLHTPHLRLMVFMCHSERRSVHLGIIDIHKCLFQWVHRVFWGLNDRAVLSACYLWRRYKPRTCLLLLTSPQMRMLKLQNRTDSTALVQCELSECGVYRLRAKSVKNPTKIAIDAVGEACSVTSIKAGLLLWWAQLLS